MAHHLCLGPVRLVALGVLVAVTGAACGSTPAPERAATALGDDAITVASFDFPESELLAEIYGQALERAGYEVEKAHRAGPRELVDPALVRGLVELVPEYSGTAIEFLSLGATDGSADAAANHAALERVLADRDVEALDAASAENRNTLVVREDTARRLRLDDVSDLASAAPGLRFGGPPECPTRPLCLPGLQETYGLRFREFVPLDTGGPLTLDALDGGLVDVALLFTTDPAIGHGVVALSDDRALQPAENITPIVHREVLRRWGRPPADRLDRVSQLLTTSALRALNAEVASTGRRPADVAAAWLDREGLL
jgi:osmoprotectant transport system substrate-binding protein